MKKRFLAIFMVCTIIFGCLTGCSVLSSHSSDSETSGSIIAAVNEATSVKASVSIELLGRLESSSESGSRNAAIGSDITVTSTKDPFSYHGEYYSSIVIDGATTREDKEYYVIKDENDYIRYEYSDDTGEWTKDTLTRAETLSLPLKTCLIYNWEEFMSYLSCDDSDAVLDDRAAYLFSGYVPPIFLQELVGDMVFGSFMYSLEQLLDEELYCTAYFDAETYLPMQIEIEFGDSFLVDDMSVESGIITAQYSEWSETSKIDLPKKINIVAVDENSNFYATYYAWNLFLPYITGATGIIGSDPSDETFTTSWETYQMRIDQGMTSLPLSYEGLYNLGYSIAGGFSGYILEPNTILENVVLEKGGDQLICTFYNADANPRPIGECSIGCIDAKRSLIPDYGILLFLPGDITLDSSREAILSAYGSPDEEVQAFSCDTYTWYGAGENQSLLVEINPVTSQVIRIRLENVPIMEATYTEPTDQAVSE